MIHPYIDYFIRFVREHKLYYREKNTSETVKGIALLTESYTMTIMETTTEKPVNETINETILTIWKNCVFSENIFAWFEYGQLPVFSDKIEDLMLPEDHYLVKHEEPQIYEVYSQEFYVGRLYVPKNYTV